MSADHSFSDVRLLGRILTASGGFPGVPAEFEVAVAARDGTPVVHRVRVSGPLGGASVSASPGDTARILGELGVGGVVVVSGLFGEFTVLSPRTAPPVLHASPVHDSSPAQATRQTAPAPKPAMASQGVRIPFPRSTPGPVAGSAAVPAVVREAARSAPPAGFSSGQPAAPRQAFQRVGMTMRPGRPAAAPGPAAASAPLPAPPPAPRRSGRMLGADHDDAPREEARVREREDERSADPASAHAEAPGAFRRPPPSRPDQEDLAIPW